MASKMTPDNFDNLNPNEVWDRVVGSQTVNQFCRDISSQADLGAEIEMYVESMLGDEGELLDNGEMPWSQNARDGIAAKLWQHIRAEQEWAAIKATRV